jgi:hypothetical protein
MDAVGVVEPRAVDARTDPVQHLGEEPAGTRNLRPVELSYHQHPLGALIVGIESPARVRGGPVRATCLVPHFEAFLRHPEVCPVHRDGPATEHLAGPEHDVVFRDEGFVHALDVSRVVGLAQLARAKPPSAFEHEYAHSRRGEACRKDGSPVARAYDRCIHTFHRASLVDTVGPRETVIVIARAPPRSAGPPASALMHSRKGPVTLNSIGLIRGRPSAHALACCLRVSRTRPTMKLFSLQLVLVAALLGCSAREELHTYGPADAQDGSAFGGGDASSERAPGTLPDGSGIPDTGSDGGADGGLSEVRPSCSAVDAGTIDDPFWAAAYVDCEPSYETSVPPHHAGNDCMTCHGLSSLGDMRWAFAGTVSAHDGGPAAGVEIGVRTAAGFWRTHSAANGTFWARATGDAGIDWTTADVRLRTARGQRTMVSRANAGCSASTCHGATGLWLLAP